MKILHVISSLDPAAGGPPQVVARLSAAQASLGHHVTIASGHKSCRQALVEQMSKQIPGFSQVECIVSPTKAGFRSAAINSDIVHLHGVWDRTLRVAAAASRDVDTPYVVAPHGMLDPWSLGQKRLKKRFALLLYFRHMLNHAAFLHALNKDEASLIEPLRLQCPVKVIPNGVSLEEIEPLPKRGRFFMSRPELEEEPFILFLSRLHYKKGLDVLIDAFVLVAAQVHNVRLVVAGPASDAKASFRRRVEQTGMKNRVHLVGPIYGREKYEALMDASCFCLPSRQEGFSVAILEALACSTPVVISEQCHFPEVQETGAGRVVKLEPTQIASALIEFVNTPAARSTFGSAGRQLVENKYTWPTIAQRAICCYRENNI